MGTLMVHTVPAPGPRPVQPGAQPSEQMVPIDFCARDFNIPAPGTDSRLLYPDSSGETTETCKVTEFTQNPSG